MLRRPTAPLLCYALLALTVACTPRDHEDWMVANGYWAVHTVCGGSTTTKGIDVSKWQATVSWSKVAADGVKWGIARVSDGTKYDDAYFTKNYQGMKQNGIIRGSYQFFRPDQDPIAQANFYLNKLKAAGGLKPDDLPPVLDLEKNGGKSASGVVAAVDKWIAHMEKNTNRRPIIYTGSYFWDANAVTKKYSSYPLWTAHYTSKPCPLVPNAWNKWTIWQYTSSGKVNGVSGNCDVNRFNGSLNDVKQFVKNSVLKPQDAGGPKPDKFVPKPDKFVPKADKFVPKADKFVPKPDLKKPKLDAFKPKQDKGKKPKLDRGKKPKLDTAIPGPAGSFNTLSGGCNIGAGGHASVLSFLLLLALLRRRRRS